MDRERMLEIAEEALKRAREADQAEASLFTERSATTRFADSRIHQNVHRETVSLTIRVALDGKLGSSSSTVLTPEAIVSCARSALAIARVSKADPDYSGLPSRAGESTEGHFSRETYDCSPDGRLRLVISFVDAAGGLPAFGALETGGMAAAVVNSRGLVNWGAASIAEFEGVVTDGGASGYASACGYDLGRMDFPALSRRACLKATQGKDPAPLEAGEYTVVLEPDATATLLLFLGFMGFSAKAYQEGRSFLSDKLGNRVASPSVTIVEDAAHTLSFGLTFDREGVFKRRVALIEKGVAVGMVHDTSTAAKAGTPSTGHASGFAEFPDPTPGHLVMKPGSSTLGEMIAATELGLLITRFHYTNVVDFKKTFITGMTRDGTFLIRDGLVAGPVKNMRFTQGIIEALDQVEDVSADQVAVTGGFGDCCVAPAVKVARFAFTSGTSY